MDKRETFLKETQQIITEYNAESLPSDAWTTLALQELATCWQDAQVEDDTTDSGFRLAAPEELLSDLDELVENLQKARARLAASIQ